MLFQRADQRPPFQFWKTTVTESPKKINSQPNQSTTEWLHFQDALHWGHASDFSILKFHRKHWGDLIQRVKPWSCFTVILGTGGLKFRKPKTPFHRRNPGNSNHQTNLQLAKTFWGDEVSSDGGPCWKTWRFNKWYVLFFGGMISEWLPGNAKNDHSILYMIQVEKCCLRKCVAFPAAQLSFWASRITDNWKQPLAPNASDISGRWQCSPHPLPVQAFKLSTFPIKIRSFETIGKKSVIFAHLFDECSKLHENIS